MLEYRKPWRRQPTGYAQPAAKDTLRLYLPTASGMAECVSGRNVALARTGAVVNEVRAPGFSLVVPSDGYASDADDSFVSQIGEQLTAWVYITPKSRVNSDFFFGRYLANRTASGTYAFGLYWGASGSQAYVRNSAGTVAATPTISITANRPQLIALTYDGATIRHYQGNLVVSVAQSGSVYVSNDESVGFGGWNVTSNCIAFEVHAAAIANRCYSPAEISKLASNPWFAFEPRRILVPQAAASGLPTLGTVSATAVTSSGFRPSVTYTY